MTWLAGRDASCLLPITSRLARVRYAQTIVIEQWLVFELVVVELSLYHHEFGAIIVLSQGLSRHLFSWTGLPIVRLDGSLQTPFVICTIQFRQEQAGLR